MDAKRVNKEYSNAEAVDIIHQVANLYISTKFRGTTEPGRSILR